MCPRTKSLGCSVHWTMNPKDDATLGRHVLDRCVLTLDRPNRATFRYKSLYICKCTHGFASPT
jgi:hypothetical protein